MLGQAHRSAFCRRLPPATARAGRHGHEHQVEDGEGKGNKLGQEVSPLHPPPPTTPPSSACNKCKVTHTSLSSRFFQGTSHTAYQSSPETSVTFSSFQSSSRFFFTAINAHTAFHCLPSLLQQQLNRVVSFSSFSYVRLIFLIFLSL